MSAPPAIPVRPHHRRALHQRRHHRLHAAHHLGPVQGLPDAQIHHPAWRRRGALPLGPLPRARAGHEAAAARGASAQERLLRHLRLPPAGHRAAHQGDPGRQHPVRLGDGRRGEGHRSRAPATTTTTPSATSTRSPGSRPRTSTRSSRAMPARSTAGSPSDCRRRPDGQRRDRPRSPAAMCSSSVPPGLAAGGRSGVAGRRPGTGRERDRQHRRRRRDRRRGAAMDHEGARLLREIRPRAQHRQRRRRLEADGRGDRRRQATSS